MDDHLTQETIEVFIARRLPAAQVVRLFEHIEDCEPCSKLFREAYNLYFPSTSISHKALADAIFDGHLESENNSLRRAVGRLFGGNLVLRWQPSYAALLLAASLIASSVIFWHETQEQQGEEVASSSNSTTTDPYSLSTNLASKTSVDHNDEKNKVPFPASRQARDSDSHASATSFDKFKKAVSPSRSARKSAVASTTNDGGRQYGLDEQEHVQGVRELPPEIRESVAAALRGEIAFAETLVIDSPDEIVTRSVSSANDDVPAPVSQTYPVGIVLLQERPKMLWRDFVGANSYQVTIVDEGYDPVVTSPLLNATEWQPNEPLPRGKSLRWQVIPFKSGHRIHTTPNAGASFWIISQEKSRLLMQARKTYPSHLTLGVLYAREGLLDEAECELKALQKKNPRSRTVRKLLSQIRAKKRSSSVGLRCHS